MNMRNESEKSKAISRRFLGASLLVGSVGVSWNTMAAQRTSNTAASHGNEADTDSHAAIERLLYRYAIAIDYLDSEAFKSCFVAGARMEGKAGATQITFEGDIATQVIELHRKHTEFTMHRVLDHIHAVQGERAVGVTYGIATWVTKSATGELTQLDQYMRYYDELAKQSGRWLFWKRRMEVLFTTKIPVSDFFAEQRSGKVPLGVNEE